MSPAAQMPSAEVASCAEHATPPVSPSASPAERASITSGTAPVPMTTKSASSGPPRLGDGALHARPRPRSRASGSPHTSSTPRAASSAPKNAARVGPKSVDSGASSSITSVHAVPISSARRRPRRRCTSRRSRTTARPRGILADRGGVAQRPQVVDAVELGAAHPQAAHVRARGEQRVPKPTSSSVESLAKLRLGSSFITLVRVSSSTPRTARGQYVLAGRRHRAGSPSRAGGRS